MPKKCPECGALLQPDVTPDCQSIFDAFLVLEFTDAGFGAVHFLTVACFMVQHGRYSDEALPWIAEKLRENIEQGIPAEQIRREAARETGQDRRTWKVTRPASQPPLPPIAWSMTIADVAMGYLDAQTYRDLITRWARVTLTEMRPWLER